MFIADLHIHSRYSRATSPACEPVQLEYWARRKGLHLIASGDFTHAAYREELRQKLEPAEEGLYRLKAEHRIEHSGVKEEPEPPRFIISSEISSIYKDKGRVRKIHNVILMPSIEAAEMLSQRLEALGCNLKADGRPIIGLSSHDLLELTLEVCDKAIFIPAHIWTPHFSLFGAYSGYDKIEECFEDLTPYIHALETGLSSDPQMNLRLAALQDYALVSNSDAHSPANLAREANLFACELSYPAIAKALATKGSKEFVGTIEFFPEEGKYHWDGHRSCKYFCTPSVAIAQGNICPVCGGKLILGVSHRVEELADYPEDYLSPQMRPYEKLVPLAETIASCAGMTTASKKVTALYERMLRELGPEFYILREAPLDDIARISSPIIAEGISRLREGRVTLAPGYDGAYGKVTLFTPEERDELTGQTSIFGNFGFAEPAKPNITTPHTTIASAKQLPEQAKSTGYPYNLNQEQWQAVSSDAKEIAVLAGPGTGKTRTLIYRIIHLLDSGVAPDKITAVTFTNKAAGELQERLLAHYKNKKMLKRMRIGTFHSLALRTLRENGANITIIDEYAAQTLADEALKEQNINMSAKTFLRELSRQKNGAESELSPQLIECYQQKLAAYQAADFDDILLNALTLATDDPNYGKGTHLLVDEFQDINELQLRLIEAWAKRADSLFIIGDPDQSIYGFRGSKADCFEIFLQKHPQAQTIGLTENYRSTAEILNCAQAFLSDGHSPKLHTSRTLNLPVRLKDTDGPLAEGIYIAEEIDRLVGGIDMVKAHNNKRSRRGDQTHSLSDIAVLYRTHKQAEQIAYCLDTAGIPYTISGREDFLEDDQVHLCLSFFRTLIDKEDAISRLICNKALGEVRLQELQDQFALRTKKEKAATLISSWIDGNFLGENQAMEKLLHTAVLCPKISDLLANVASGKEADIVRSGSKEYVPEAVSLMTLHGAKGLEYPIVFVAGLKEGVLPFHIQGLTADEDEEKRLFFVGMTRAKDELILVSRPEQSSFLRLIPEEMLVKEAAEHRMPKAKQLSLFE